MSDEPKLVKIPDWLEGVQIVGDTLVIPGNKFTVHKVTVEDIGNAYWDHEESGYKLRTNIEYHVKRDPYYIAPSFMVSSG